MLYRTRVLTLVMLLACSNTVAAETTSGNWQVGASIGFSQFNIDTDPRVGTLQDPLPTSAGSDSDTYSLYVEYSFNSYFSLQGGYTDFGSVDYVKKWQCTVPGVICTQEGRVPIEGRFYAQSWNLVAKGALPLSQTWELFGGVGASYVEYSNRAPARPGSSGYGSIDRKSEKWSPALEFGIRWKFAERWSTQLSVGGTWDVSDPNTTGKADLYTLSLGINYQFGQPTR